MDTSKTDNGQLRSALCGEKYVRTEMWVLYSELQNFLLFCSLSPVPRVLPNFIPRGGLALPDFPGLLKKSSFTTAGQSKNSKESISFSKKW